MSIERLKWAAIICFVVSLGGLLIGGIFANREAPPYPGELVGPDGTVLFTRADIFAGQDVCQQYGLMDHGSVWGHGSQRGMEFSSVALHVIGEAVREWHATAAAGKPYASLTGETRDLVDIRTKREMKQNQYNAATDVLQLTAAQVAGLKETADLWEKTFRDGDPRYGFLPQTVQTQEQRTQIGRFFFWTAWVASANRPDEDYSYTNNWPPDRSVGNVATAETYVWSLAGIISLFITLGLFVYWVHSNKLWYGESQSIPLTEKLLDSPLSSRRPSSSWLSSFCSSSRPRSVVCWPTSRSIRVSSTSPSSAS